MAVNVLIWTMEYREEVFVVRYILSVVYGLHVHYKFTSYSFTIMTFD